MVGYTNVAPYCDQALSNHNLLFYKSNFKPFLLSNNRLQIACIDKWVNSKFEDAHPLALCSGPKLAIWNKNEPARPEKNPRHGEKCKMAILPLFGHARVLGEKTKLNITTLIELFSIYMTSIHPQTSASHPYI